jgi:hypothetical protein
VVKRARFLPALSSFFFGNPRQPLVLLRDLGEMGSDFGVACVLEHRSRLRGTSAPIFRTSPVVCGQNDVCSLFAGGILASGRRAVFSWIAVLARRHSLNERFAR